MSVVSTIIERDNLRGMSMEYKIEHRNDCDSLLFVFMFVCVSVC